MIEMSLSEDFLKGFNDRLKGIRLDENQSKEYKNGWWEANWKLQMID